MAKCRIHAGCVVEFRRYVRHPQTKQIIYPGKGKSVIVIHHRGGKVVDGGAE